MPKCPNLARLGKPPLYSHVHFYRQHPGSPSDLCQRKIGPDVLDPAHPATKTPPKHFPSIKTECFRLSAFPNALLIPNPDSTGSPAWPTIDTWANRISRAAELREKPDHEQPANVQYERSTDATQLLKWVAPPILLPSPKGSIPMTLYFSIGKARTHKHAVKRRRLRTKLKEAINLIVTRGAQYSEARSGPQELIFDDEEVHERGNKWILPDWTYICYPDPPIYLLPYTNLVQHLRSSLQKIWDTGTYLENSWAEAEMRKLAGLPPLVSEFKNQRRSHSHRSNPLKLSPQPKTRKITQPKLLHTQT